MGLLNIIDPVLNIMFLPFLKLGYFWAIFVLSVIINVIIILVYKKATDQTVMKQLKGEIKELQAEMKTLKDTPEKMMEVQKRMMSTNMKYMKKSMKPTLYTFIPIIILFGWMGAHFAYLPIMPTTEFTVSANLIDASEATLRVPEQFKLISEAKQPATDGTVTWGVKALEQGDHFVILVVNEQPILKRILVTKEKAYRTPTLRSKGPIDYIYSSSDEFLTSENKVLINQITIGNKPVKPFGQASLFGWKPGWFGTYFILAIALSISLRKLLKVY